MIYSREQMNRAEEAGLHDYLKLSAPLSMNNMHLFSTNGKIKKYASTLEIIDEFFDTRLNLYSLRKEKQLHHMSREIKVLDNQARFFDLVRTGQLKVINEKKADLLTKL